MSQWFRACYCPNKSCLTFHFVVLLFISILMLALHTEFSSLSAQRIEYWGRNSSQESFDASLDLLTGLLSFYMAFCGFLRPLQSHPLKSIDYFDWLYCTPFNGEQPIPLDTPSLRWMDMLLPVWAYLVMKLTNPEQPLTHASVISGFCVGYTISATRILWITRDYFFVYALATGLAILVWAMPDPTFMSVTSILILLIASKGLRDSLSRFPWEAHKLDRLIGPRSAKTGEMARALIYLKGITIQLSTQRPPDFPLNWRRHAWNNTQLLPVNLDPAITWRATLFLAAWVTFTTFAILQELLIEDQEPFLFIVGGIAGLSAVFRFIRYYFVGRPPISPLGRIATMRWVIPGWDKVLLGPTAIVLSGIALPAALWHAGAPLIVVMPVCAGLVVLSTAGIGPSLASWQLTGRITVPTREQDFYQQTKTR